MTEITTTEMLEAQRYASDCAEREREQARRAERRVEQKEAA